MPLWLGVQGFDFEPVFATGLRVALYAAAKQAEQLGYRPGLASNRNGQVCFELTRAGG